MSLADFVIESFGGYEKAKAVLDIPNAHFLHNIEGLKQRLLEYRRQHNIFEVGDKVVIPSRGNGIFRVSHLLSRGDVKEMQHATDEEIKVGKRLEGL